MPDFDAKLTGEAPRRRLPAARRRNQLLDVALDVFGAKGYHQTSMDDIAERAGVTKPVLYQHFHSKSSLYLQLVNVVGREMYETVASSVEQALDQSPHQRVLAGFKAYFHFVSDRVSAFRLLFGSESRQTEESAVVIKRIEAEVVSAIAGFIEAGVDAQHRELLGYAIVGLAEVTSRQWVGRAEVVARLTGGDGPAALRMDPKEGNLLAERLADLVWAGLRGLPQGDPSAQPPGRVV